MRVITAVLQQKAEQLAVAQGAIECSIQSTCQVRMLATRGPSLILTLLHTGRQVSLVVAP